MGFNYPHPKQKTTMQKDQMKIAFSGTSGSGKTTLVEYVSKTFGIQHISGSAGDLKTEEDKMILHEDHGYPGGGHAAVIKYSALNLEYGLLNQKFLVQRRAEMIKKNKGFVTDRSPADNVVYGSLQVGYHPSITDEVMEKDIINPAKAAWDELTHVIYVKSVQPNEIEMNHRRVANKYFQKCVDAAFEYWINRLNEECMMGPEILIIDFWDLDERKERVQQFLGL
jgi:hypothetical protein